jgi:hypothetical protein
MEIEKLVEGPRWAPDTKSDCPNYCRANCLLSVTRPLVKENGFCSPTAALLWSGASRPTITRELCWRESKLWVHVLQRGQKLRDRWSLTSSPLGCVWGVVVHKPHRRICCYEATEKANSLTGLQRQRRRKNEHWRKLHTYSFHNYCYCLQLCTTTYVV